MALSYDNVFLGSMAFYTITLYFMCDAGQGTQFKVHDHSDPIFALEM